MCSKVARGIQTTKKAFMIMDVSADADEGLVEVDASKTTVEISTHEV